MPKQYCFLCASDEGVFLDITADNKQIFREQLETCSLVKGTAADELFTKICHKCAYELNQCSSFVKTFKQSYERRKQKIDKRIYRYRCSFCSEPTKKGHVFDLSKDKNLVTNPISGIRNLFNHDLEKWEDEVKLMCLACRYTLDVLLDLKSVFQETSTRLKDIVNEEIDYLSFPKIKTIVVSRRTTITESARVSSLCTPSDSDSDSSTMARGQSRVSKLSNNKSASKSELRVCGKCHSTVENGGDMYRFHTTGLTVCKSCWITVDPSTRDSKKRTRKGSVETKLCTVFLKDVLTDSVAKGTKAQKGYKVETDDQGNAVCVVLDDSSESEATARKDSATTRKTVGDVAKQGKKRPVRSSKADSTDSEDQPNKKFKSKESTVESLVTTTSKRRASQSSDSDISLAKVLRKYKSALVEQKKTSLSDADVQDKHSRKKLKNILGGVRTVKGTDVSDESTSNEDVAPRRKKIRFASASPVTIEVDTNKVENVRKTRSSAAPSKEPTLSRKPKISSQKDSKPSTSTKSESEDKESADEKKTYVCEECGTSNENKLVSLTHKLTHFKQPQLKLEKVAAQSTVKDCLEVSELVDEQNEEQSEAIGITIEDDEEEATANGVSSSKADRVGSPEKETVKDAVDTKLVTEESNGERNEEMDETMQEKEGAETTVTKTSEENIDCSSSKGSDKEDEDSHRRNSVSIKDKNDDMCKIVEKEKTSSENEDQESLSQKEETEKDEEKETEKKAAEDKEDVDVEEEEKETQKKKVNEEIQTEDTEDIQEEGNEVQKKTKKDNEEIQIEEVEDIEEEENEAQKKKKEDDKEIRVEDDEDIEEEENEVQKRKKKDNKEIQIEDDEDVVDVEDNEVQKKKKKDNKEIQIEDDEDVVDVEENEVQKKKKDNKEIQIEDDEDVVDVEEEENASTKKRQTKSKFKKDFNGIVIDEDEPEVLKKDEQNGIEEKDAESETEIRIVDTGSSEDSVEQDLLNSKTKTIEICDDDDEDEDDDEVEITSADDVTSVSLKKSKNESSEKDSTETNDIETVETEASKRDVSKQEKSKPDSALTVAEVLQEVFDLATAEVQKRRCNDVDAEDSNHDDDDAETLENISREVHNSVDMPSLEVTNAIESKDVCAD